MQQKTSWKNIYQIYVFILSEQKPKMQCILKELLGVNNRACLFAQATRFI
jgi:hypothetical protein